MTERDSRLLAYAIMCKLIKNHTQGWGKRQDVDPGVLRCLASMRFLDQETLNTGSIIAESLFSKMVCCDPRIGLKRDICLSIPDKLDYRSMILEFKDTSEKELEYSPEARFFNVLIQQTKPTRPPIIKKGGLLEARTLSQDWFGVSFTAQDEWFPIIDKVNELSKTYKGRLWKECGADSGKLAQQLTGDLLVMLEKLFRDEPLLTARMIYNLILPGNLFVLNINPKERTGIYAFMSFGHSRYSGEMHYPTVIKKDLKQEEILSEQMEPVFQNRVFLPEKLVSIKLKVKGASIKRQTIVIRFDKGWEVELSIKPVSNKITKSPFRFELILKDIPDGATWSSIK